MRQINCFLFDLDGTLLDSRDSVIDAVYHTSEKYFPGMFDRYDLLQRYGECKRQILHT
ncbi:HAD hydrolase-like protein [Effusibacillus pohliae]|uniref:HAD hydrolase-like protein n=1 Tax=Effusibacillus pohliae TaxID=232270 RepID=UPI00037C8503|nr:HAD hydrolase-like protein [Effusibacillus pohliae]